MDDLPELPFEKVLSYLSLEHLIKSRAVSRAWRNMIDRFRVKTLCSSIRPSGFIIGKSRFCDVFAQNFIQSTRFQSFFSTFDRTILSNLKHLRLCGVPLGTALAGTIQSFGLLEQLDLLFVAGLIGEFELSLPMLSGFHVFNAHEIEKLTLEAPRLRTIKYWNCPALRLNLVHVESVERLIIEDMQLMEVKNLKNLKELYTRLHSRIDSTLLSSLEHLKEIHLNGYHLNAEELSQLFEQKRRYNRVDLKIFRWGLLLNGPDDPEISSALSDLTEETFRCLSENPSRLADQIPLVKGIYYWAIESIVLGPEISVLNQFTDLDTLIVTRPISDIPGFLQFLKNFEHISLLNFSGAQPQELFDGLPEHSAVQYLAISDAITDFEFLFKLKQLISLELGFSIDEKFIREVFEEFEFLSMFMFDFADQKVEMTIASVPGYLKIFEVNVNGNKTSVRDLDSAIQFVIENMPEQNASEEDVPEQNVPEHDLPAEDHLE